MRGVINGFIRDRTARLQGEQGMGFMLSLLILGLAVLLVTSLMVYTQTTARQADKVVTTAEATLMAEAGVDFYYEQLRRAVAENPGDARAVVVPEGTTHNLGRGHHFTIQDVWWYVEGNDLYVSFRSVGEVRDVLVTIDQDTVITP